MYENKPERDAAVLIGLVGDEAELGELEELLKTAGGYVVGRITQPRERAHPGHYVGKGKLEEVRDLCSLVNATTIVCDDELSAAQQRGLAEALDVKVLDRTMVILDIFAARASTAEGKLQVELAQLSYNLAHLTGLGKQLSRLGGGIGTRGPGEKKLETDRRHIRTRITELEAALGNVRRHRATTRAQRKRNGVPVVSMVGYTNAGKSSLMNALCGEVVPAEDKLFATLDTTTRSLELSGGMRVVLTDTVGFIRKLPHGLVKAFRATLEELSHADVLLHVVDSANPEVLEQMQVVRATLGQLGCTVPTIEVFNKADLLGGYHNADGVSISAKTGQGLQELREAISNVLNEGHRRLGILVGYEDGQGLAMVHSMANEGAVRILHKEEREGGTHMELLANEAACAKLRTLGGV